MSALSLSMSDDSSGCGKGMDTTLPFSTVALSSYCGSCISSVMFTASVPSFDTRIEGCGGWLSSTITPT